MKSKIIFFTVFFIILFSNFLYSKLIAEYRIDECTISGIRGEIADSSGNNYNATGYKGVKIAKGKICRCANFDGVDDYIDLNHNFSWKSNNSFTIILWFKLNESYFSIKPIILIGKKNFEYALMYERGRIIFEYKSIRGFYSILIVSKPVIRNNIWNFIAVSYNGKNGKIFLYINGKKVNWLVFNNRKKEFLNSSETTKIGFSPRVMLFRKSLSYSIDEVKIFNESLNEIELKKIFENENRGKNWNGSKRICEICNFIVNPYFIEITDNGKDNKGIACEPELICFTIKDKLNRIIKKFTGEIKIGSFFKNIKKGKWFKFYPGFNNPDPPKGNLIEQGKSVVLYRFRKEDKGKFCIYLENKNVISDIENIKIVTKTPKIKKEFVHNIKFLKTAFKILWSNNKVEPWKKQISCLISDKNPKAKSYVYVEAVTSDSNGACEKLFNGNKKVKARIIYIEPNYSNVSKKSPLYINSSKVNYHSNNIDNWDNLVLNFIKGRAKLNLEYRDAGKIKLEFAYNLDKSTEEYEILTLNSENIISFSPFGIYGFFKDIDAEKRDDFTLFSTKLKAGEDNFTINVQGVCYDPKDDIDKNGIPDKDADFSDNKRPLKNFKADVKIYWNIANPVNGEGKLSSDLIEKESFYNGTGKREITFSNTGIIKINYLTVENYLEKDNKIVGWPLNKYIGLFIPHHYRVRKVGEGTLFEHCGTFSFIGKEISYLKEPYFEIVAENKSNDITTNYSEKFFILKIDDIVIKAPKQDERIKTVKIKINKKKGNLINKNQGKAIYIFGKDNIIYLKDNNQKISPFSPLFSFIVEKIEDENGIKAINLPVKIPVSGKLMRYCRLKIVDNYGPETENLIMNIISQYWEDGWKINKDDSCTFIEKKDFVLKNFTGNIAPNETKIIKSSGIKDGIGKITLLAPGKGNSGSVEIEISPFSSKYTYLYDKEGKGKANFGIFRGRDRIIMWEEIPAE